MKEFVAVECAHCGKMYKKENLTNNCYILHGTITFGTTTIGKYSEETLYCEGCLTRAIEDLKEDDEDP